MGIEDSLDAEPFTGKTLQRKESAVWQARLDDQTRFTGRPRDSAMSYCNDGFGLAF